MNIIYNNIHYTYVNKLHIDTLYFFFYLGRRHSRHAVDVKWHPTQQYSSLNNQMENTDTPILDDKIATRKNIKFLFERRRDKLGV